MAGIFRSSFSLKIQIKYTNKLFSTYPECTLFTQTRAWLLFEYKNANKMLTLCCWRERALMEVFFTCCTHLNCCNSSIKECVYKKATWDEEEEEEEEGRIEPGAMARVPDTVTKTEPCAMRTLNFCSNQLLNATRRLVGGSGRQRSKPTLQRGASGNMRHLEEDEWRPTQ